MILHAGAVTPVKGIELQPPTDEPYLPNLYMIDLPVLTAGKQPNDVL